MPSFRFSPAPNSAHLIRWREWAPEAFDEAVSSDKLIAVFVTAFWCGVCQRLDETALSSEEVQLLLNAYFIPIRVEESRRPDVDLRYTQEGWPTIAFLTPHGEPVLTVNALEAEQLLSLLVHLVDTHDQHRAEFAEPPQLSTPEPPRQADASMLSQTTVESIIQLLEQLADHDDGGFGGPHKYFLTDALTFYLYLSRRDERFLQHVELTLHTLIDRTIYDAADGGFFRYSSKPDWNEPHREKLLMDQADLLRLYLDAFELTYDVAYQRTAERLIVYMDQVLGSPSAPFFSGCQDFIRAPDGGNWTPIIDPLVYCDANAHAAAAYFRAGNVLGRADCRERGVQLLDALWTTLRTESGGIAVMQHYFDGDGPHVPGLLSDAVAVGRALLDGYASVGEARFLEHANVLANDILRMHFNPDGGFFDISTPGPAALQRPLTELTQNATAALFFLRLAQLRNEPRLRDAAQWALLGYGGTAEVYGAYAASFGHALAVYLAS